MLLTIPLCPSVSLAVFSVGKICNYLCDHSQLNDSVPGPVSLLGLSELLTKPEAIQICVKEGSSAEAGRQCPRGGCFWRVLRMKDPWRYRNGAVSAGNQQKDGWQTRAAQLQAVLWAVLKAWCHAFVWGVGSCFFNLKEPQNPLLFRSVTLTAEPFCCLLQNAKSICVDNGKESRATGGIRRGVRQSSELYLLCCFYC